MRKDESMPCSYDSVRWLEPNHRAEHQKDGRYMSECVRRWRSLRRASGVEEIWRRLTAWESKGSESLPLFRSEGRLRHYRRRLVRRRERNGSCFRMETFPLSSTCTLQLQLGDITKWFVDGISDAVVNTTNPWMLASGGVDAAIHRAAGPELVEDCSFAPEVQPGIRCPVGEAWITSGHGLPVFRIIHTVGPIYCVEEHSDVEPIDTIAELQALLRSAYRSCLRIAKENHIQYIAYPAISCGVYGYPLSEASLIAISTVKEFADDFKEVHFALFTDDAYSAWLEKAIEIL